MKASLYLIFGSFVVAGKRCLETFSVVSYIILSSIVFYFLCKNFKTAAIKSIVGALSKYVTIARSCWSILVMKAQHIKVLLLALWTMFTKLMYLFLNYFQNANIAFMSAVSCGFCLFTSWDTAQIGR